MNPSKPNDAHHNRNKSIIAIIIIIGLLIVAGVTYWFLISRGSSSTSTIDDSSLYLENETIPEPPAKSERIVNATIEDTDTSNTVTATKVVINPFALPKLYAVTDPARTVVLVEFTATSNGKYSGSPSGTDVMLVTEKGAVVESTLFSDGELAKANYKEMGKVGPKIGTTTTGYVAYLVPTEQVTGELSIRYTRPKTTVIYGDDLPEKTFDAKL